MHRPLSRLFLAQSAWNFGSMPKIKFQTTKGALSKTTKRIFSAKGGGEYPPIPPRKKSAKKTLFFDSYALVLQ